MEASIMKESFMEKVYLSMDGQLQPEYMVPGVENIFEGEAIGLKLYTQARDAYDRICDRLGVQDEDEDLDTIINSMEEIAKEMAYRMYRYGAQFGIREA